jgi:predicted 2-oxoglutarate/Fe(II)-dependent dioxygenase YbiX
MGNEMPRAEFFERFGVFVARGFLDAELTSRLRAEMEASARKPATVGGKYSGYAVDESVRRTKWAQVAEETRDLVHDKMMSLKPLLEEHFGLQLTDCQLPQFLVYREGDFFVAHRDSRHDAEATDISRERKVATVLFVNEQADPAGTGQYSGGDLTLFDLIGDARAAGLGMAVQGEPGLLVAFRTETLHSVTPVAAGERYTIVNFFT